MRGRTTPPIAGLVLLVLGLLGAAGRQVEPPVRLTHDGREKIRPSWSPDGRTLAFARHEMGDTAIWQYLWEPEGAAAPRRLTDRKTPEYQGIFARDGRRLFLVIIPQSGTQGNLDLASVAADGGDLRVLRDDGGKLSHQEWPAPSPDGRRVAFTSTHEGNQEVYTSDADGSDLARLTRHPGLDAHPCWSPDGRRIAFATDRWGGLEIASMAADGSDVRRLTTSPGLDDYPAWNPDGSTLAFVSHRDGNFEVYRMNAEGADVENLTNAAGRDLFPTWRPDGSLTFVSDREGGCDLYTLRVSPR